MSPFAVWTTSISKIFLKSAAQGLPDGQDGQVRAGSGSHVGPEGPDQLWVRSSNWLWTNFNKFQQKSKALEKKDEGEEKKKDAQ